MSLFCVYVCVCVGGGAGWDLAVFSSTALHINILSSAAIVYMDSNNLHIFSASILYALLRDIKLIVHCYNKLLILFRHIGERNCNFTC